MLSNLKNALRIILSYKDNKLDVRNIKYLPRWMVLLLDVCLLVLAIMLSAYILQDLIIRPQSIIAYSFQISTLLAIHAAYFFIYRTYSGLIRHSSMMDALKLLLAVISTVATCSLINLASFLLVGEKVFINTGLMLYAFISFTLLFLFRLGVKQLYEFFKIAQKAEDLIDVAIVGIDENAISIVAALDMEHPRRFNVKGFVTRNNFIKQHSILGKPVIRIVDTIIPALDSLNVKAIIITSAIDALKHEAIVEECLEQNVKLYRSPIVSSWEEGLTPPQIQKLQIEDLLEREPIVLNKKNNEHQLQGKTILVTGGAGSIGSEIVRQIATYVPKTLLILDQAETPLHNIQLELQESFPNLNFRCIVNDVRNKERLSNVFKNNAIDVIYHAAAYKHVPLMEDNPQEAIETNILGTKNVADLAVAHNVSHVVMVSTDKAVNPSNVMGASKRASEMYVQSLNFEIRRTKSADTKFITTRFGNVLGSNGSVVPLFKKQIEEGGPITITHPDILRYFMTIPEACQLVLEAGAMGKGGEIFIFDMGAPVKIMDLAKKMIKLAGYIPDKDIKIKITGLRPGEKLYEELLSNGSTTLPTHHEKIMISKDCNDNYNHINEAVVTIIKSSCCPNQKRMVKQLKALIPEFKSKNSCYESLDALIKQDEVTSDVASE